MSERKALNYIPLVLLAALLFITGCEEDEVYKTGLAPTLLETRAAWSPDGSTIAYAGSGGIWLVDADGTNDRYLSPGFQADWSPDGERLVIATLDWNIYLIDKDGANFEWLVRDWSSNSPAWSPDGKWIAYWQPFVPGGLFWLNIETQERGGEPDAGSGDWAPARQYLVYFHKEDQARKQSIRIIDIQDSSLQTVIGFNLHEDGALTGTPHWSSKGDRILFQINIETWVIDTSGENLKCLADSATYPNWSHDGKHIVYTPYEDSARLWIMNANGWNKHPLGEE